MRKRCCGTINDAPNVIQELNLKLVEHKNLNQSRDVSLITIGVVFHICYENPNISMVTSDVNWTLEQLNKDYNANPDNLNQFDTVYTSNPSFQTTYNDYKSRIGNMSIQFVLSQIVYVSRPIQTSSNISVLDSNVKSYSEAINPEKLLNVWIADLNSGLLGYAQFPWEFNNNTKKYDGVLIAKGTFGPNATYTEYNLNRTLTHEIGHWFGLYHTFQTTFAYEGGNIDYAPGTNVEEMKGDCVIDTPPQSIPTYGNPFTTNTIWPTSKPSDELQFYRAMFMNFMDYVDDVAMFMFTNDQAIKMRMMISLYRPLILSDVITIPTSPYYICDFDQFNDFETWKISSSSNVKILKSTLNGNNTNVLQIANNANVIKYVNLKYLNGIKTSVRLSCSYITNSPTAYMLYKSPSQTNWKIIKLTQSISSYKSFYVNIYGPFNNNNLQIKFQTKTNKKYLQIDNITIVD